MSIFSDLTVLQLQRALDIKKQIESLERELGTILNGSNARAGGPPRRGRMSAAGELALLLLGSEMGENRKGRSPKDFGKKSRRRMSAAVRARIAAAARARWATAKAAGKNSL